MKKAALLFAILFSVLYACTPEATAPELQLTTTEALTVQDSTESCPGEEEACFGVYLGNGN